MRVATRRLRAMLAIFGEAFDAATQQALRLELRWLASVQGAVRDLDVHLMAMPRWRSAFDGGEVEHQGWDGVEQRLERLWNQARVELLEALDGERYRRLVELAGDAFAPELEPPTEATAGRLDNALPGLLRPPLRRFRRAHERFERERTVDAAHRLRIAAKRVRYATDMIAPMLGSRARKPLRRLQRFQDALGELQDATVAAALAERLAKQELQAEAAPSVLFVLGQLHGASMAALEQAPSRVRRAIRALEPRKLRRTVGRAARDVAMA